MPRRMHSNFYHVFSGCRSVTCSSSMYIYSTGSIRWRKVCLLYEQFYICRGFCKVRVPQPLIADVVANQVRRVSPLVNMYGLLAAGR